MEKIFKAKRLDNGEWVEFTLDQCNGSDTSNGYRVNLTDNLYYSNIVRVDPETICQYTDMGDKEGNKIFEGDEVYVAGVGNVIVEITVNGVMFGDESYQDCIEDIEHLTGKNIHDD